MKCVINQADIDFLKNSFIALTAKRNYLKPSDYVCQVRYMTADLTPFPGKFSFKQFPYFKEIVDNFSPESPIHKVYIMKGNQLGATTAILETVMLYGIGCNPAPMLYVLPDEGMAKLAMDTKIDRMIDTSGLRNKIFAQTKKAAGARNTGDTSFKKEFPGGYLHAVGGRSGNRFRNFSYKIILVDELDGMSENIKGEGTMEDLAIARSDAYPSTRKIYFGSTPTVEQTSKIWRLYQLGDERRFFVPCKYCGEMQPLEWAVWDEGHDNQIGGIVWENDENFQPKLETVGYKCPYCCKIMKNYDKAIIMEKGEWRPTKKSDEKDARSYHLSPIYNPPGMFSWEDFVIAWAKCWDIKNNRIKDKEGYRAFRNLKQGLPFREQNEQIRREKALLHKRYGFARGKVPNKMAVEDAGSPIWIITCAVDVQKECLYVDTKGFSDRGVTWTVDFQKFNGPTEDFYGVWDRLAEYIENTTFVADDGKKYKIAITLVDSGHYTDWVYAFCARFTAGVYACKGSDWIKNGETYQLFNRKTLEAIGLPLAYHINTGKLKDRISRAMNMLQWDEGTKQPDWFPNFPDNFHDDYFRMFEAEEKVEEYDKRTNKYIRTVWRAKPGAANHGFDTYVYNLAALEIFADSICRNELQGNMLDWSAFWNYAAYGMFTMD